MGDKVIMSRKEIDRIAILEGFACGKLDLKDCALRMGVSYRQAKRIWRRYREKKAS